MAHRITSLLTSESLLACATCMGDAGSLINKAAGYAIVFMLAMLAVVLGSLIKFMCFLSKRDRGIGLGGPEAGRPGDRPN